MAVDLLEEKLLFHPVCYPFQNCCVTSKGLSRNLVHRDDRYYKISYVVGKFKIRL